MSTSSEATKSAATSLTRDWINLAGYHVGRHLGGRRGLVSITAAVLTIAGIFNWSWLVAIGLAPLIISLAPCAVMCALGLCMSRMGNRSCSSQSISTSRDSDVRSSSSDLKAELPSEPVVVLSDQKADPLSHERAGGGEEQTAPRPRNETTSERSLSAVRKHFTALLSTAAVLASLQLAQAAIAGADQAAGVLVYAPQTHTLYKADGQALSRSSDGGKEWSKVPLPSSMNKDRITAVAVSAAEQGELYVAGPGVGVLKSVDAGKSWVSIDQGLPSDDVIALAAHSTSPATIYAVLAGHGIYRSEDGGKRWRMVDKGPQAQIRRLIHSNLEGSMQSGWLFAATDKGVYRAMDCFCGFRPAGSLAEPVSAVTYDAKQPKQLYAAVGKHVFTTADGGEQWQAGGSPGGEVSALAYSPSGVLYALLADGRIVRSLDKGKQWE